MLTIETTLVSCPPANFLFKVVHVALLFFQVYGAAVMFYEEYDQDSLTDTQKQLLGLVDENPSDYKIVQKKSVHS